MSSAAGPSGRGAKEEAAGASGFSLLVCGQIVSGDFGRSDNLYCRYQIDVRGDWRVVQGVEAGLTQIARRAADGNGEQGVVWNFPIDLALMTTNAHNWPRIAFAVYGLDLLGRDVIHGYGSLLVPTSAGSYERVVPMYRPVESTLYQKVAAFLTGNLPEFFDLKFVARSDNRDVTRVATTGSISLHLQVLTQGMEQFGYAKPETGNTMPFAFSASTLPSASAATLSTGSLY